jgi:glycosyltransferase involved in cell wall biosynthesis
MPRRLKVLMSAYACEPNKGSEPADGWNWVQQMSRWHDLWVLTRANNRSNIEQVSLPTSDGKIHWVYYDLPAWARFWKKGNRGIQLYYYLWQLRAWRVGRRLHREIGFDLMHHVTFGKYWVPSYLTFLPVKSVLGPVGGGESTPPAFAKTFSGPGRRFEWKRDLARRLAEHDPALRAAIRRASAIAATTADSKSRIERLGGSRVTVEPQFGMNDDEFDHFAKFPLRVERPFRLLGMGRLLHWKGFHLGLQAFARFHRTCPESEYWVVSDGPEAGWLKQMAADLGVAQCVTFWGRLPRLSDVYEKLSQADVLVHPATHEAFGNVCLEALAAGRPVICLDTGGPSLQVTKDCGFKAPVGSVDEALNSMADAMAQLYRDPQLRLGMGAAARERARTHFHWRRMGEKMNAVYQQVCGAA